MLDSKVIIAGGGIAGLTLGLTLHQIGVPFTVFEAAREMKPLGVGINLQPNAVRELFDLGITADDLDKVGLPAEEWALVGLNGREVYAEPRGLGAGYNWPQYAVHRGLLHMLLYDTLISRAGADAVQLGSKVTDYTEDSAGVVATVQAAGANNTETGAVLVAADGIHSAIRAQMYP
ncbi:MAG: FAD-dependent monooxygenase, partial [Marivita sp.]